jgi:hypothetical protein
MRLSFVKLRSGGNKVRGILYFCQLYSLHHTIRYRGGTPLDSIKGTGYMSK